eukprot:TRINITY_DN10782_c0_g1_i6.p1 TRINITY_DN10782_c0_g1~~TRINITY_DN10782_c0_g1_i6.p1  ORF type:complete len:717 (+),score=172.24 TRINITY_DN10782_c0_g1_i6:195-2345(+)
MFSEEREAQAAAEHEEEKRMAQEEAERVAAEAARKAAEEEQLAKEEAERVAAEAARKSAEEASSAPAKPHRAAKCDGAAEEVISTPGRKVRVLSDRPELAKPANLESTQTAPLSPSARTGSPRTPALTARTQATDDERMEDVSFNLASSVADVADWACAAADAEAAAVASDAADMPKTRRPPAATTKGAVLHSNTKPPLPPGSSIGRAVSPAAKGDGRLTPPLHSGRKFSSATALSALTEAEQFTSQASALGLAQALNQAAEQAIRHGLAISEPGTHAKSVVDSCDTVQGPSRASPRAELVEDLLLKQGPLPLEDSMLASSNSQGTGGIVDAPDELGDGGMSETSFGGVAKATAEMIKNSLQEELSGSFAAIAAAAAAASRVEQEIDAAEVFDHNDKEMEPALKEIPFEEERRHMAAAQSSIFDAGRSREDQERIVDMESVVTEGCTVSQSWGSQVEADQQDERLDIHLSDSKSCGSRSFGGAGPGSVTGSWAANLPSDAATDVAVEHATAHIAGALMSGFEEDTVNLTVPAGSCPLPPENRHEISSLSTEARDNDHALDTGVATSPASPWAHLPHLMQTPAGASAVEHHLHEVGAEPVTSAALQTAPFAAVESSVMHSDGDSTCRALGADLAQQAMSFSKGSRRPSGVSLFTSEGGVQSAAALQGIRQHLDPKLAEDAASRNREASSVAADSNASTGRDVIRNIRLVPAEQAEPP